MHGGRGQMHQHDQDNGKGLGLAGYTMWKSDTKSVAWVSSDIEIYSDSSPVSSYPSQITLYRSLHVHQWLILELSYTSPPVQKTTSLRWCHLRTIQARLPWQPPFSQHVLWQCCNPPGILSSMAEILLFNSVFHNRVTPVSVSTLKSPLRVIGVLPLKPQASPILSICI